MIASMNQMVLLLGWIGVRKRAGGKERWKDREKVLKIL
jgi:hypothetical protein